MIVFRKSHPIQQAVTPGASTVDLNDGETRRNPGEPSPDQAKADSYKKPAIKWRGLTLRIENPAGSVRRGPWGETRMKCDYGYVCRSEAVDGDEVDVYLGQHADAADTVYVVHQRKYGDWSAYDEDKCMIGFLSQDEAESAYLSHYDDPRFLGPVTAMPVDEFIEKVKATREAPAMIKSILFFKSMVAGHTRRTKDGKVVTVNAYSNKVVGRAKPAPNQIDMFRPAASKPWSPPRGVPEVQPDMFAAADEHGEVPPGKVVGAGVKHDPKEAMREFVADSRIKVVPGRGLIAGKFLAMVDGNIIPGGPHNTDTEALSSAESWRKKIDEHTKEEAGLRGKKDEIAKKLRAGGEASEADIKLLDLKPGASGLKWFIPAAADLFGVSSRSIRPVIASLIRTTTNDFGSKTEWVTPSKALAAIGASLGYNSALSPAKKFYVTMIREPGPRQKVARLAGPFDTHEEALSHVDEARRHAIDADGFAAFDAFGTSGIEADDHKPGVLNERLGIGVKQEPTAEDKDAPFDLEKFDRERNERIKASRGSGAVHLDRLQMSVEAMRGKKISYVHGDEKGMITTVSNGGAIYVRWETGLMAGQESFITPNDAKDYVVLNPGEQYDANGFLKQRRRWKKDDAKVAALDHMIKIAADSVEQLRKPDVYRVLDAAPADKVAALARYIANKRPDLADEVGDVMSEEIGIDNWATMTKSLPGVLFVKTPPA